MSGRPSGGVAEKIHPHPLLPAYYDSLERRSSFLRALFNAGAADYDRINRFFFLGTGGWYRRRTLRQAGLRPGHRVLDVAVGTGLLAREAIRITGDAGSVIGLDLSENMLSIARRLAMPVIHGRAEDLPIADATVDRVTMGYALRHVPDLCHLFEEFQRVLRPGGRVLILEIAVPRGRGRALLRLYLGRIVPLLSRWIGVGAESPAMMHYYWQTVENCVAPVTILDALGRAGFEEVRCATDLGCFRAYSASRS